MGSELDGKRRIDHRRFVNTRELRVTVLQHRAAVGDLDPANITQSFGLSGARKGGLLVQKLGSNAANEFLPHLNVQSFVLALNDGAKCPVNERHKGKTHWQIAPGCVRRT